MANKAMIVLGSLDQMNIVPGTVQITADCGHEAVCAPSTKKMYDADPDAFETVCILCLDPKVVAQSMLDNGGFARVPGAREEFAAIMGEEEAKRLDEEVPWMKENPK